MRDVAVSTQLLDADGGALLHSADLGGGGRPVDQQAHGRQSARCAARGPFGFLRPWIGPGSKHVGMHVRARGIDGRARDESRAENVVSWYW